MRITRLASVVLAGLAITGASACGPAASSEAKPGIIEAVGAENQYADIVGQIGGLYVHVSSVLNNPNTDPHTFESSPRVAQEISRAKLIVQNGLGYDDFMTKIESGSSNASRRVIVVQHVLGLPDSTPNPHLWYSPTTMPAVAAVIGNDLAALQPAHAAYFNARVRTFDASLAPWTTAIATFKARFGGTPVATTEPVADYLLQAMGADNLTPFGFQADIMNGTDPTPQDISLEKGFFTKHQVKVFCYNEQVVDDLTASIRAAAIHNKVPLVGVYETMPTPGYDYQSWMLAEVNAITRAVADGTSSQHL
jgi:zinc/manganese transport system substrate-binding protein